MEVFDNDDKQYFMWINNNPNGYVVNTERRSKSRYFVLHKSNCPHISTTAGIPEGGYTCRQYIKVCSENIEELQKWFILNRQLSKNEFTSCRTCNSIKDLPIRKNVNLYPDSIMDEDKVFFEGAKMSIVVNSYERNEAARQKCLKFHGYLCSICETDFEKTYGQIGKEFIHVHHKKEISEIGKEYIINPADDLIPICPNCHSMIHQKKPCYTIDELRATFYRDWPSHDKRKLVLTAKGQIIVTG